MQSIAKEIVTKWKKIKRKEMNLWISGEGYRKTTCLLEGKSLPNDGKGTVKKGCKHYHCVQGILKDITESVYGRVSYRFYF